MNEKILVVEDDYMLNSGLCYNLELEGFSVAPAYTMEEALKKIKDYLFDLYLLDVNLPDGNGFDICKKIREISDSPVIFLTAKDMEDEIMSGYDLGADDYITKPFNIKILLKKINSLIKRAQHSGLGVYISGDLIIDYDRMTVNLVGEEIVLTPTEYKLLRIFTNNPGILLTRQVLLEKIWDGEENFVDEHALTVNINRLRSKIEKQSRKYIKTIYGMGYTWTGVN